MRYCSIAGMFSASVELSVHSAVLCSHDNHLVACCSAQVSGAGLAGRGDRRCGGFGPRKLCRVRQRCLLTGDRCTSLAATVYFNHLMTYIQCDCHIVFSMSCQGLLDMTCRFALDRCFVNHR